VKIEILYLDDCPNHKLTAERVFAVLEELQVQAEIVHINVENDTMATQLRFPGSPTVRVNGEDVVLLGEAGPYALRCRVYPTDTGITGAPGKDAIRRAIRRSAA
jgi:hypothetical protein